MTNRVKAAFPDPITDSFNIVNRIVSLIIPPALGASDPVMVERVNIAPLPVFTAPREQVIVNSTHPVL